MSLGSEFLNSPNICSAMVTVFDSMKTALGGGDRVLALLYFFFFVIPLLLSLGVGKNAFFGLLGGFIGHTILLLLLNSHCLTISTDYLIFNWVFEIILVGLFIVIVVQKEGFG